MGQPQEFVRKDGKDQKKIDSAKITIRQSDH